MNKENNKPQIRFSGFDDAWEQRKLKEVSKYVPSMLTVKDIDENGKYDLYDANDLIGKTDKLLLSEDYISIIKDGAGVGRVRKLLKNTNILGTMGAIIPQKNDYNFLFCILEKTDFTRLTSGGTIPHIYFNQYGEEGFSIPSMFEQRLIGQYFQKLDNLITLHQRKYDKLVNVKKSMLEKMFPRNGANMPEIRFKGFTGAWKQRKFEDIAIRSSTISSDTNLPRVEYEDIISGTGCLNKDIFSKESDKTGIVFHKGDVLYGKLRPYLKNWLLPSFNGLAVGDFWVLQPQNADSNFLYRLIQSHQFDEVANQSTGTKMPRADWKLVSKTQFFIPITIDEQALIGIYFEQLDNLITLQQSKLEKLKNIKKACLAKMFV